MNMRCLILSCQNNTLLQTKKEKYNPISDSYSSKTIPFSAAHTHIAYIGAPPATLTQSSAQPTSLDWLSHWTIDTLIFRLYQI